MARPPLAPILVFVLGAGPLRPAVLSGQIADATEVVRSLGEVDGPAGRIFDRVASVHPLPGGRLLVADGGSRQIRVYGPDPDPVWTFGREGQGPGEFAWIDWVAPYRGDSLVAWDAGQARLTVVTGSGELGRTIALGAGMGIGAANDPRRASAARLAAVGPLADGRFVARRGDIHVGPGDTTAVRRDPFAYVLLDAEGAHVRELVTLPDDEQFVWANERSRSVRPRAFGRVTATDTEGSAFAWAVNDRFRATVMELGSGGERALEAERAAVPVADSDRRRWIERHGPDADAPGFVRAMWEDVVADMPFPAQMPWHGGLVLAPGGEVWLEEYRGAERGPAVWTVFGDGGAASARVRFPAGFRLTAVADRRAYGVSVGDFDVQRVTVIALPER